MSTAKQTKHVGELDELHLVNKLSPLAITADRVTVPALQASQAAITLEKAGLDGAWVAGFNIAFSHQEAEDPQERSQAWLDVTRITSITSFREFDELCGALSPSFPFVIHHFEMAFCVRSLGA